MENSGSKISRNELLSKLLNAVGFGSDELKAQIEADFNTFDKLNNVIVVYERDDYQQGKFSIKFITESEEIIKKYELSLLYMFNNLKETT